MNINIKIGGQLRNLMGKDQIALDLNSNSTAKELIVKIVASNTDDVKKFLLDETGCPRSSILAFRNNEQILLTEEFLFKDNDTITLMPPISGG